MAGQNWWQRAIAVIEREYERRVRAASLVSEYGADHHAHDDHPDAAAEAAVILNIPRGTPRPPHPPESPGGNHA